MSLDGSLAANTWLPWMHVSETAIHKPQIAHVRAWRMKWIKETREPVAGTLFILPKNSSCIVVTFEPQAHQRLCEVHAWNFLVPNHHEIW